MSSETTIDERTLNFQSPKLLQQLYCGDEANLGAVEEALGVTIVTRDDWLRIQGESQDVDKTAEFFDLLNNGRQQGLEIRNGDFYKLLEAIQRGQVAEMREIFSDSKLALRFERKSIVPRTPNQKRYLKSMQQSDVVFGIGPAGTGKTYLAVAAALDAMNQGKFEKLILTRPAVEAGEALGFLPGDLQEKILPYLRPLYDAMHEMLGQAGMEKKIDDGKIEIAPLAYMRGRTLSEAFVILDEAQNTTPEQMMMFLTRMGEGSRLVITGDITQVDLPRHKFSGLKEALEVLAGIPGIDFHTFEGSDVVRHPIIQKIIEAYQRYNDATGAHQRKAN